MHHEVRVRQLAVDLLDPLHHQHFAGRLLRELICAVAGADRDCKRIDSGTLDELDGLVGIGQVDSASTSAPWPSLNAAEECQVRLPR